MKTSPPAPRYRSRLPADVNHYRALAGDAGEIMRLVWGADDAEFDAMLAYEENLEQSRRVGAFVKKHRF